MPNVIYRDAVASETVPGYLDGDIKTDLAAVFEAVSDCSGGLDDKYLHLLDCVPLHPGGQGVAGGPDDTQGHRWISRRPRPVADHHPHLMWQLRREFVESESGEQADSTVGRDPSGFSKAVRSRPFRISGLTEVISPHATEAPRPAISAGRRAGCPPHRSRGHVRYNAPRQLLSHGPSAFPEPFIPCYVYSAMTYKCRDFASYPMITCNRNQTTRTRVMEIMLLFPSPVPGWVAPDLLLGREQGAGEGHRKARVGETDGGGISGGRSLSVRPRHHGCGRCRREGVWRRDRDSNPGNP